MLSMQALRVHTQGQELDARGMMLYRCTQNNVLVSAKQIYAVLEDSTTLQKLCDITLNLLDCIHSWVQTYTCFCMCSTVFKIQNQVLLLYTKMICQKPPFKTLLVWVRAWHRRGTRGSSMSELWNRVCEDFKTDSWCFRRWSMTQSYVVRKWCEALRIAS